VKCSTDQSPGGLARFRQLGFLLLAPIVLVTVAVRTCGGRLGILACFFWVRSDQTRQLLTAEPGQMLRPSDMFNPWAGNGTLAEFLNGAAPIMACLLLCDLTYDLLGLLLAVAPGWMRFGVAACAVVDSNIPWPLTGAKQWLTQLSIQPR